MCRRPRMCWCAPRRLRARPRDWERKPRRGRTGRRIPRETDRSEVWQRVGTLGVDRRSRRPERAHRAKDRVTVHGHGRVRAWWVHCLLCEIEVAGERRILAFHRVRGCGTRGWCRATRVTSGSPSWRPSWPSCWRASPTWRRSSQRRRAIRASRRRATRRRSTRKPKTPTGRKPGGQPGHKRHEREMFPPEKVRSVSDCKPVAMRPVRCTAARRGPRPASAPGRGVAEGRAAGRRVPAAHPGVRPLRACTAAASCPPGTPTGSFGADGGRRHHVAARRLRPEPARRGRADARHVRAAHLRGRRRRLPADRRRRARPAPRAGAGRDPQRSGQVRRRDGMEGGRPLRVPVGRGHAHGDRLPHPGREKPRGGHEDPRQGQRAARLRPLFGLRLLAHAPAPVLLGAPGAAVRALLGAPRPQGPAPSVSR